MAAGFAIKIKHPATVENGGGARPSVVTPMARLRYVIIS